MKNNIKTVGVVIPIYNVEKYLRECLDSVINQSYTNLENSLNIAKEYTLKDKRITLFDKKNGGLSSARNVGIEYFSGEYKLKNKTQTIKENSLIEFNLEDNNPYEIYTVYKSYKAFNDKKDLINFTYPIIDYIIFLDSDDYWELNCIEECVPRMDGVEVLWFDHFYYHDDIAQEKRSTLIENCRFYNNKVLNTIEFFHHLSRVCRKSFWFSVMGMINFAFLKLIRLKFLDGVIHEDHYFGKLLFFQSNFIYIMPKKLYFYRIRKNSIMNYNNSNSNLNISAYCLNEYIYLDKNYIEFKSFYKKSSLFVTSLLVLQFLQKNNKNSREILLYNEVFADKLKLWRDDLLCCEKIILKKRLYLSFKRLFKLSPDLENNLEMLSEFIADNIKKRDQIIQENSNAIVKNINPLFSAKYRIKNHLSYKLGKVIILNCQNLSGIILMPIYILSTIIYHKQNKKISFSDMKNVTNDIPKLKDCFDYKEAIKIKKYTSYQLGNLLLLASKNWYKGGYLKLPFDIYKMLKNQKKRRNR